MREKKKLFIPIHIQKSRLTKLVQELHLPKDTFPSVC